MQLKSIISIFGTSISHWRNHRATRMGAALSYYTIFSIVPLLLLFLVVSGPFFSENYIQKSIVEQSSTLISVQSADFIKSILVGLSRIKFNFYTIIISIGMLIVGTLGVFYELKSSIDDLWDTKQNIKEEKDWKYYISSHILSLSMIPILGFLLVVSIVFSSFISYISVYSQNFADMTYIFQVVSYIFTFFILSFLFTFIYRFLPKRKLPWRELVRGAIITAILFMFGKFLISIYITKLTNVSIFGAAEAFVVLLLWIFYSVQIFLFGASLTYVYSRRYGHLKEE
ncbi:MAG: YihY/virulence factor BrkB family protein [Candidatus Nomurabacteria bacterium]|nr:YihY/virulence factor BrkB family protein [Candidatus Nomurabacteria bacterium]